MVPLILAAPFFRLNIYNDTQLKMMHNLLRYTINKDTQLITLFQFLFWKSLMVSNGF